MFSYPQQDLNVSNERNSALRSEQREVKAQWLSEKSELESRHFQTMALCTQTQGTLRKKDRDYEKLQVQRNTDTDTDTNFVQHSLFDTLSIMYTQLTPSLSLQTQLSKISSKSTHKAPARAGSKPDPSAVPLVISKPLRRNHTQAGNPQEGSLQEAELGAARASISALEVSGGHCCRSPPLYSHCTSLRSRIRTCEWQWKISRRISKTSRTQ